MRIILGLVGAHMNDVRKYTPCKSFLHASDRALHSTFSGKQAVGCDESFESVSPLILLPRVNYWTVFR